MTTRNDSMYFEDGPDGRNAIKRQLEQKYPKPQRSVPVSREPFAALKEAPSAGQAKAQAKKPKSGCCPPKFWNQVAKTRGLTFLLVATLVYLVVEFAFSAWLIDVLGGPATKDNIKEVEHWGRIISGFAVALMFWPRCFAKTRTYFGAIFRISIISCAIIFTVYHAE